MTIIDTLDDFLIDEEEEEYVAPQPFTLTDDQQKALMAFNAFLLDPNEQVFVLSGYAGCGKSTLVRTFLDHIPKFMKVARLINPKQKEFEIALTASTNKAAESLAQATNMTVKTIHSFLGLRLSKEGGRTKLVAKDHIVQRDKLLFIDEASFVDPQLLNWIFTRTDHSKVVFIGDPAQLSPVTSKGTPVFESNFGGAQLNEVVRQAAGNPIIDLATKFRHTVNTGQFFSFVPDGVHVQYLPWDDFQRTFEAEFTRPGWKYQDSKILAYTNTRVIKYNHLVRTKVLGDPHFVVGDYAICNAYISNQRQSIKTDQLVMITKLSEEIHHHGVTGKWVTVDGYATFFHPNSVAEKKLRIKQAQLEEDEAMLAEIELWIDLRAAYACTINKAQGSTFDRVFIDLDDIRSCTSGNQIARMMYVAVSRARHQVFLTGDLA